MNDIIKDLEKVIEKHREKPKSLESVIRYIPICDQYADASYVNVFKEKGGDTISISKVGTRKVLAWLTVHVDPQSYPLVRILHESTLCLVSTSSTN